MFKYPFYRMGSVSNTAAVTASLPFYVFQGGPKIQTGDSQKFFDRIQKDIQNIGEQRTVYDANIRYGAILADVNSNGSSGHWSPADVSYYIAVIRPYFDKRIADLVGAPLIAAEDRAAKAEAARVAAENSRLAAEAAHAEADAAAEDARNAASTAESARLEAESRASEAEAERLDAVAQADAATAAQAAAQADAESLRAAAAVSEAKAASVASNYERMLQADSARRRKAGKMMLAGAALALLAGGVSLIVASR